MRILVYEHLSACGNGEASIPTSLSAEGRAMRDAVSADFAAIPGVSVTHDLADAFDAALLIAPETDGILAGLARKMESAGRTLLSPSSVFCAWASDKTTASNTLAAAGISVPCGRLLRLEDRLPREFSTSIIVKPNDGCGSQGVRLFTAQELNQFAGRTLAEFATQFGLDDAASPDGSPLRSIRFETYHEGLAASIALLRGPAGIFPLPPCMQELSDDGRFTYRGGRCPLTKSLAVRAESLALRAAAAMPTWRGYIGLDLVLGAAEDGSQDFVIEVNPRLTTSYVGLRALCRTNLAEAMLEVAAGRPPLITLRPGEVAFDAAGTVSYRRGET